MTVRTGSFSLNANKEEDWNRMVEQGKELLLTMKDYGMLNKLNISEDSGQFGKHVQKIIENTRSGTNQKAKYPPDSEVEAVDFQDKKKDKKKNKKDKKKNKKDKKDKKKNKKEKKERYATDKKGFVKLKFH